MKNPILDYFPFENIRPSQASVLDQILEALKTHKYIVLEAPTGFGKSPVAIALAKYLGSSYICTSTINLQDQYLRDFSADLKKVIGKSNFICTLLDERKEGKMFRCDECDTNDFNKCEHTTVDKAPCLSKKFTCHYMTKRSDYEKTELIPALKLLSKNPKHAEAIYTAHTKVNGFLSWEHYKLLGNGWSPCPYYDQKNVGLNNNHTIFNYSIFNKMIQIGRKMGTKYLSRKRLLILDEGHLLEHEVISNNGEELEYGTMMYITHKKIGDKLISLKPERMTVQEHIQLLEQVIKLTEENIETMKADHGELLLKISGNKFSKNDLKKIASYPRLINYMEEKYDKLNALKDDIAYNPDNWVINVFNKKIIYKPLDISKYCKELYECTERVLVMSATILDKNMYCKQIGMNPDEVAFISVDSDFPVENRPIFKSYIGRLSKNNIDLPSTHRVIANKLCSIMKRYNTRGIIHMPTNKLINDILPYMEQSQRRRLYVVMNMTSKERTKVLTDFENDELGVLISPSLYVGIDLKDDLSRFQIVTKIPYPSLADKWIAKKAEDKRWYNWTTVLKVIQGCGRCLSDDTEILTDKGWKGINEITTNDKAMGLHKNIFEQGNNSIYKQQPRLEWSKITSIYKFNDNDNKMVSIKGIGIDGLITKDHTMVILPYLQTRESRVTYQGNQMLLLGTKAGLKKINALDLMEQIRFRIPLAGYYTKTVNGRNISSRIKPEWFELMGLILSDGHINKSKSTVTIYQSDKEDKSITSKRITEILSILNIKYNYYIYEQKGDCFGYKRNGKTQTWVISGIDALRIKDFIYKGKFRTIYPKTLWSLKISNDLKNNGYIGKLIPLWVFTKSTTIKQRKYLLNGLMEGDGTWYGNIRNRNQTGKYFTSNKDVADFVQTLLTTLGYRSTLNERKNRKGHYDISFTNKCWTELTSKNNISLVDYDNINRKVWCVTTENGTIVTRRNGKIMITGNSIRHVDDHADTYILDSNFDYMLKYSGYLLPKTFKESIKYGIDNPNATYNNLINVPS